MMTHASNLFEYQHNDNHTPHSHHTQAYLAELGAPPILARGEPGRQLRTDDIGTDWSPASSRSMVVLTAYATEPRVPDGERDFAVCTAWACLYSRIG